MRKMKRYIRTIGHGMLAFAWVAMSGCADDWDAHYDGQPRPEQTLWQEISSRPELADFAKLLQSRGYDKYLDSDQRYTVWAPVGHIDTTLVTGEFMTAEEVLTQVVTNHIARGIVPASSVVNDTVLVLNGKPMPFVAVGGVPCFNGSAVSEANIECGNGDLHILKMQAPYNHNIWSYLRQDSEFSDIADYLYSFNHMVFDPDASTPGGVVNGEQVYIDSVFVMGNELWQQIGYLNNESEDYTMLVPVNTEWHRLVDWFKTFYNYADEENLEKAEGYACRNVLDALVFDMGEQVGGTGYWETTSGLLFQNPYGEGGLFSGATPIGCSNGTILKGADIKLDPYGILAREIVIEGEDYDDYLLDGRYNTSDRPTKIAVAGTGVSSNAYMTFTSTSPSRGAEVTFALPDVLSCAYDIGVVFVPTNMTRNGWSSTVVQKKCRVDFELEDGYTRERTSVEDVEIPGTALDTIWVARNHVFEYCDYNPDRESIDDAEISLTITATAKRSESDYTRDLYIDCIVLKPTVNEGSSYEE